MNPGIIGHGVIESLVKKLFPKMCTGLRLHKIMGDAVLYYEGN